MAPQNEPHEPIPTDYDIAQSTEMEPIWKLIEPWGLGLDDLQNFGEYTAKSSSPTTKPATNPAFFYEFPPR